MSPNGNRTVYEKPTAKINFVSIVIVCTLELALLEGAFSSLCAHISDSLEV